MEVTNLVRYTIHLRRLTHSYIELLHLTVLVFPGPEIDLSVGVQTTSRAPFVFVFSGVQSEGKHE